MTESAMPDYRCCVQPCPVTRPRLASDPSDSYARAAGWHVFSWLSLESREVLTRAICPEHMGSMKRKDQARLDGEQTLW